MLKKSNPITLVATILLIIGGLNWGLVGLFNFDLVAAIFGSGSILARIVYVVVGLSAIGVLLEVFGLCPLCKEKQSSEN